MRIDVKKRKSCYLVLRRRMSVLYRKIRVGSSPVQKGDVLERNGERCEVDHWNVIATTFAEGKKLRRFNVEDAEKALEYIRKVTENER